MAEQTCPPLTESSIFGRIEAQSADSRHSERKEVLPRSNRKANVRIVPPFLFLHYIGTMKTKEQKKEQIEKANALLQGSTTVVFADFSGMSGEETVALKAQLRERNATMSVIKKRLMNLALQRRGVTYDLHGQMEGQAISIFSPEDISEIASVLYAFSKDHQNFQLLGGVDLEEHAFIGKEDVIAIGKLPSRQTLLGQVVGSISSPLSALLYVLNGRKDMLMATE